LNIWDVVPNNRYPSLRRKRLTDSLNVDTKEGDPAPVSWPLIKQPVELGMFVALTNLTLTSFFVDLRQLVNVGSGEEDVR
jgi:hypothetical protein